MTILASDIVTTAIQQSYPYVWEPGLSYGSLLAQLTQLDREATQVYAQSAKERLSASGSITLVIGQNPTGYTLQASAIGYSNFKYIDTSNMVWPINIVPWDRLDRPGQHPAAIIKANTFYPADPVEMRWAGGDTRQFYLGNGDKVTYDYILFPPKITTLTQALSAPDEARDFLTTQMSVNILLGIGQSVPAEVLQYAVQRAGQAKQDFMLNAVKRTDTRGRFGDNKT